MKKSKQDIPRQLTLPLQTEAAGQIKPTSEQWQAIHQEGNHILVSASAGSGKTRVLVQRIMQKITRGFSIRDMLVVTFTDLAASEMKERIEKDLKSLINNEFEGEERQHYLKQMADLQTANISTIDAFCRQIIQRFYYIIGIDPIYRLVTDKTEILMQRDEVFLELKEILLSGDDTDYQLLLENFTNGRSDNEIDQIIYTLYDKARVHAHPDEWLNKLLNHYDSDSEKALNNLYVAFIQPEAVAEVKEILRQLKHQDSYLPNEDLKGFVKMKDTLKEQLLFFANLEELIENGSYDTVYQYVSNTAWPNFSRKNKKDFDNDDLLVEEHGKQKVINDNLKERYKAFFEEKYFAFNTETQQEFLMRARMVATALINVEKKFIESMAIYKSENKMMDFADIELSAYQILTAVGNDEKINEAVAYYRDRFSEVMIDEYQDVNALQEAILSVVAHQEIDKNMFMVGDVKQSIYRFRFAEPGLFIDKYNHYESEFKAEEAGHRIILQENFRSRKDVLYFINYIFEQIMDTEVGQIDYDESARLKYGFTGFPESEAYHTELLLYDEKAEVSDNPEDDVLLSEEAQVEIIAQKIKEMQTNNFAIYDKDLGQERPVQYSDFVILSSTRSHHLQVEQTFREYGIPLQMDNMSNYFKRIEINIMISVLQWIDNPYQDIPFAAVLRSPIVNLTEPEMATIRLANQDVTYYEAFLDYLNQANTKTSLYTKLYQLNEWHQSWRTLARDHSIAFLIWQIYDDTGFLDYAAGMPNGLQRQNNLHGFYHRADDFEKSSFKGLFQFIRYIENIQKREEDLSEPKTINADQNVVQLMTIHGSKGLEFPVVFYLNISKRFNMQDIKGKSIYNDRVGVGVSIRDRQCHINHSNLIQQLVIDGEKKDTYAEEMRKLYVAMTRAEQKLILVGTISDADSTFTKWAQQAGEERQIPAMTRLKAQSPLDWIGPSLIRHKDSDSVNYSGVVESYLTAADPMHFDIQVISTKELKQAHQYLLSQVSDKKVQSIAPIFLSPTEGNGDSFTIPPLMFDYPYQSATHTTTYQSVSELKRLFQDPVSAEMVNWTDGTVASASQGNRYVSDDYQKPSFMLLATTVPAAEIGSAIHLLMQNINLGKEPEKIDFEKLFDYLVERELIRQEVKAQIKFDQLVNFYRGNFGKLLLKEHQNLLREKTFSLSIPADKIFADTAYEDQLLIHGTIDGFIKYEDHILLYDFKTDNIGYLNKEQQEKTMRERYKTQLDLYAISLETIYELPVRHKVIIALDTMQTFFL